MYSGAMLGAMLATEPCQQLVFAIRGSNSRFLGLLRFINGSFKALLELLHAELELVVELGRLELRRVNEGLGLGHNLYHLPSGPRGSLFLGLAALPMHAAKLCCMLGS